MALGTIGTCWACVGWFSVSERVMGKEAFVLTVLMSLRARKDLSGARTWRSLDLPGTIAQDLLSWLTPDLLSESRGVGPGKWVLNTLRRVLQSSKLGTYLVKTREFGAGRALFVQWWTSPPPPLYLLHIVSGFYLKTVFKKRKKSYSLKVWEMSIMVIIIIIANIY